MNRIMRCPFNKSLFSILSRHIKNEHESSRFFNTLKNTSFKPSVHITPKSVITSHSSTNIRNYSNESNDVAVQLQKFLEQEISSEKELMGSKTIPSKIDDFEVKLDGSEVTLTKKSPIETIKINFNINQSVESDEGEFEENYQPVNQEQPEFRSKPEFDIDITRGDTTLGFTCSYVQGNIEGDNETGNEPEDIFVINDVTLYTGEWSEKAYSVAGNILDGYLYDLLMNFLFDKGITNEFVLQMSDLSTAYEQTSYISLLRALKEFASK